ncbi:MAG: type II toxin-antitoxin system PemK/MazF family toxin [Gemmataceae bacterium]|nr:type II toxin-antitoxin system PemK/MazF family toxin [Gemmataceae bacterium]
MNRGEICLGSFPFGGKVGAKLRPVLVLAGPLGPVPEYLVAYMTSVIPPSLLPTDILFDPTLQDHAGTNLKSATLLRLHKLATIHASDLVRSLGIASPATMSQVDSKLRTMLNL